MLGLNCDKDPSAKFTMLGWTLAEKSISVDTNTTEKRFYMNPRKDEFERMCSLEIFGISNEKNTERN